MTMPLCLCSQDYFISPLKRNSQESFPLHQHDFYELLIVTAKNDIHGYKSVNNLQLDNIFYQRDKLSIVAVIEKYLPSKLADLHAGFGVFII